MRPSPGSALMSSIVPVMPRGLAMRKRGGKGLGQIVLVFSTRRKFLAPGPINSCACGALTRQGRRRETKDKILICLLLLRWTPDGA